MSTKENNMKEETSIKDEEVVNKESEDTPIETNAEGETSENKEGLDTSEEQHALSLEEQLESLKNELNESRDRYLRLMAEFDNYRKRVLREKTELILNGGERVITSMLPILDDFERVEKSMAETDDLNSLKEGVNLVIEKFRTSLEKDGLKKIDSIGEEFNTDYHEAVAMVPGHPDEIKNKVIDCIQAGYKLNDKVIRHAKVAVAE